jgi:hypothetical protein
VDATLIVADVKFGVHSMILGAESPLLQSRFQASLRKSGLREITIEEADIHTVWRTLMLIYLGYYSTSPCPKAATSGVFISSSHGAVLKEIQDTLRDESLYALVYFLSQRWGLSQSLQKLALRNCTVEGQSHTRYIQRRKRLEVLDPH